MDNRMHIDIGWRFGQISYGNNERRSAHKLWMDADGVVTISVLKLDGSQEHWDDGQPAALPLAHRLAMGVYEGHFIDHWLDGVCCDLQLDQVWDSLRRVDMWERYGTGSHGVADNYQQVLTYEHDRRVADPDHLYIVQVSIMRREDQSPKDGWRWSKWGPYIGTQVHQADYLADEPDISEVMIYRFISVKRSAS